MKKLKIDFFNIVIIFKKLSKYMTIGFFNEKSDFFCQKKNHKQTYLNFDWDFLVSEFWDSLDVRLSIAHRVVYI